MVMGWSWDDDGMVLGWYWDGVAPTPLPPRCRAKSAAVSAYEAIEPRFLRNAPLSIGGGCKVASAGIAAAAAGV
jgi:hypothetical protein